MIFLFGYVRPKKSELLVREFEEYSGIYCSLCRSLGRRYGFAARLALNYDCTFYALVLLSASPKPFPGFQKGRCTVNPLKKCAFCGSGQRELDEAAALTILLLYHKLLDDLADSGFWKKVLRLLPYPLVRHAYRRALRDYPAMGEIVSRAMELQNDAEHGEAPGVDLCAEPMAGMLGRILELSAGEEGPQSPKARVLGRFGYCLGRWIYLIDAADDLGDDLKTGSFNPFAVRFRLNAQSPPEQIADARDFANQVLNQTLSQLGAAVNLMDLNSLGPIVRNVVFLGLPQMQRELLFEKEKTNVRSL